MVRVFAARRAWGRGAAALAMLMLALSPLRAQSAAEPVKGSASLSVQNGFARMIVKLDDDVDTDVATSGSVMIMRFKRPVDLAMENVETAAPDFISAVRRDPDNLAIRFALRRPVTLNMMMAGERIFVDLLPDLWKGPPPGLPADVVRDLAERARAAERVLRDQRKAAQPVREKPMVRVRAAQQPTFMRYVFDIPNGVSGAAGVKDHKLTVTFDAPLNFDLADAQVASPPSIGAMTQRSDAKTSAVEMAVLGEPELRAFSEDRTFVVDLVAAKTDVDSKVEQIAARITPPGVKPAEAPKMPAGDVANAASQGIAAAMKGAPLATKPAAPQAEITPPLTQVPEQAAVIVIPPPLPETVPAPKAEAAPPPFAPAEIAKRPETTPPTPSVPEAGLATGSLRPDVKRSSDSLRVSFPFTENTPVALFRRADSYWLVMDREQPIDAAVIKREGGALIGDVTVLKLDKGQAIRVRLNRPQLASLTPQGDTGWTMTFSDAAQTLPRPLDVLRNIAEPSRASVVVPMQGTGRLHKFADSESGDGLLVVTANAPARGIMRRQDFVELALPETVHGLVVAPNADDLKIDVAADRVTLTRPGGLTLSAALGGTHRASSPVKPLFDLHDWQSHQMGPFRERLDELTAALSRAPDPAARVAARNNLINFYFARGFYPEAKAMLDSQIQADKPGIEDPNALILHAVASTLMGRPAMALKDLNSPALGTNYDSQLWRAMAFAEQGKWADAREKFKNAGFAMNALPFEIQRKALMHAIKASLEVNDSAGAASRMSELELVGIPDDLKAASLVLRGRISQALARDSEALDDFKTAAVSADRQAASEAKLNEIALRMKRDDIKDADAIRDLETLSMTWRGDDVEVKALQMLVNLYGKAHRYGDALAAARTATQLQPNSDIARGLQDAAAEMFSAMYLTPKGDDIPPIEALATFYQNRDLTPIGRRGDELIRRLSERLVAVDLLDQASELLQYQVNNRLEGAARAQVAARLATIYLMNRKPDRAIAALHSTRIADLAGELRTQRLLLEARAQSDIGRRDLALDIISNLNGREAIRLRSDIHWAARRWREAAEQIELYLGDRYKDFAPLGEVEKSDVVRAVIGYALADDQLGLTRFKEKYAPLMTSPVDRTMFDIASKPQSATSAEFAQIAKMAASVDTLEGFLRDMKARFPDAMARAKQTPVEETTGTLPKIAGAPRSGAR